MPFRGWADLVFSTATFHWVTDHEALFTAIHDALRPGGRLFAQCGGGPNLAGAHALARQLMKREPFARYFAEWAGPWHFATPGDTARRLIAAGFTEVSSDLEPAPTTLADESSYREFVATVIYHSHLERLPDGGLRAQWLDDITVLAAQQDPPFTLDYWRLNLAGRRPR
jgi:trans-aconitate 2-methyltransferase